MLGYWYFIFKGVELSKVMERKNEIEKFCATAQHPPLSSWEGIDTIRSAVGRKGIEVCQDLKTFIWFFFHIHMLSGDRACMHVFQLNRTVRLLAA